MVVNSIALFTCSMIEGIDVKITLRTATTNDHQYGKCLPDHLECL